MHLASQTRLKVSLTLATASLALFAPKRAAACSLPPDMVYYAFPNTSETIPTTAHPLLVADGKPEVELLDGADNLVAHSLVKSNRAQLDGVDAEPANDGYWSFPLYRVVPDSPLQADSEYTLRYVEYVEEANAGEDAGAPQWVEVSFETNASAESEAPAPPERDELTIEANTVPSAEEGACQVPIQLGFSGFTAPSWFEACVTFIDLGEDVDRDQGPFIGSTRCSVFNRPFVLYLGEYAGWVERIELRRLNLSGTRSAPLAFSRDEIDHYFQDEEGKKEPLVWSDGEHVPDQLRGVPGSMPPDAGDTPGDSGGPGDSSAPNNSDDQNDAGAPDPKDPSDSIDSGPNGDASPASPGNNSSNAKSRSESGGCATVSQPTALSSHWLLLGLLLLRRRRRAG